MCSHRFLHCAWIGVGIILPATGCQHPEDSIGPAAVLSKHQVGADSAGNGSVRVDVTSTGIIIRLTDPDGIGSFQVGMASSAGATISGRGDAQCAKATRITLPASALGQTHQLLWTDCQGRDDSAKHTSATEVWTISTTGIPSLTKTQLDVSPRVVDVTGGVAKFHAVIVGHNIGGDPIPCAKRATDLADELRSQWGRNGWRGLPNPITDAQATKDAITNAVEAAKLAAKPGEEFLFFYCDHGSNSGPDANGDEPDGHDGSMGTAPAGTAFTDDELAVLLSGFRASVTMTIVLDVCFAGDFVNGTSDLLTITDRRRRGPGRRLDKDHLAILLAASECQTALNASFSAAMIACLGKGRVTPGGKETTKADLNRDGITTADELFNCMQPKTDPRQTPSLVRGVGP